MDYIIKEKSVVEKLFDCEIDNYLTESEWQPNSNKTILIYYISLSLTDKGTFYIDDSLSFSRVLLLGNHLHIFVLELLVLLSVYLLSSSLLLAAGTACALNMVSRAAYTYTYIIVYSRSILICAYS